MRFKEFLITESMGVIASDLGAVLTSLQEYLNVLNDFKTITFQQQFRMVIQRLHLCVNEL